MNKAVSIIFGAALGMGVGLCFVLCHPSNRTPLFRTMIFAITGFLNRFLVPNLNFMATSTLAGLVLLLGCAAAGGILGFLVHWFICFVLGGPRKML